MVVDIEVGDERLVEKKGWVGWGNQSHTHYN